ncbi:MAG: dihydrofolate reductase family protein [Candidatus Rokubacteria bacterium]|nr:dihydrofolate reductase family protein [Candidatus Rokubacteria bacterium]
MRVARCPDRAGRVDLGALLCWLGEREVTAALLEGGGEINAAFLEAGLVDRVVAHIAPVLVGGRTAITPVEGAGRALKDALRLAGVTVRRVGDDVVIEGDVERAR